MGASVENKCKHCSKISPNGFNFTYYLWYNTPKIALSKKIRHISLLYMKNRCNRHNRKPIQYSLKAYM